MTVIMMIEYCAVSPAVRSGYFSSQ